MLKEFYMMGGSSFDLIAQELLRQKSMMDQMENENRELRHQLADLRAGRGFYIEIDGQRFSLPAETMLPAHATSLAAQPVSIEPEVEAQQEPVIAEQRVASRQTRQLVMDAMDAPEVQPTSILPIQTEEETVQEDQVSPGAGPTFLEEVMIDEFTSAATRPLSVWSAPQPEQETQPEATEDEELALLRRQLIGSYLLE